MAPLVKETNGRSTGNENEKVTGQHQFQNDEIKA